MLGSVPNLLAISVGNTNTRFGLFLGREPKEAASLPSGDTEKLATALAAATDCR